MTNNQIDLDGELADMTDRLLAGQDKDILVVSTDNESAAALVRSLYQMVGSDAAPSAAFRTRLTHRLQQEWMAQGPTSRSKIGLFSIFSVRQLTSLAAVLVVALVGIIFVIAYQNGGPLSHLGPA